MWGKKSPSFPPPAFPPRVYVLSRRFRACRNLGRQATSHVDSQHGEFWAVRRRLTSTPAPLGCTHTPLRRAPAPLGCAHTPLRRAPASLRRAPASLRRAPRLPWRPSFPQQTGSTRHSKPLSGLSAAEVGGFHELPATHPASHGPSAISPKPAGAKRARSASLQRDTQRTC